MSLNKRILHVVTNVNHYEKSDTPTGLWLSELTHAYDIFEKNGFSQVIISPLGGIVPLEPRALKIPYIDLSTYRRYKQKSFMQKLQTTLKPSDVDANQYDAIFFTGGHGVMWDFPNDAGLQSLTRQIYENGGIVASVCHGYCGLLNVKTSNGKFLIQDKKITGYTWVEEILAGVMFKVPYNVEKCSKQRGAKFKKGLFPFKPYVCEDQRIVTGQNPFSTKLTAKIVCRILASK
ncbi:type 1 glutamine amidotransferase domain-containing protein [Acinetobacter pragensis]|uniref:type 1 glutamine amidotransferase domain-containing protein n=1 Tax=Acinetobacter pragensis TaxID=1806892 RepID=UPI0033413534